jgi:hypothetical protein
MAHFSPAYYTRGSIECWDAIRDWELNYHLGCAVKYICRAGHKSAATKASDIKKAIHYLENELVHSHQSTGPSGGIPISLFSDDRDQEEINPEIFDR